MKDQKQRKADIVKPSLSTSSKGIQPIAVAKVSGLRFLPQIMKELPFGSV
jgi:hypothetical protein